MHFSQLLASEGIRSWHFLTEIQRCGVKMSLSRKSDSNGIDSKVATATYLFIFNYLLYVHARVFPGVTVTSFSKYLRCFPIWHICSVYIRARWRTFFLALYVRGWQWQQPLYFGNDIFLCIRRENYALRYHYRLQPIRKKHEHECTIAYSKAQWKKSPRTCIIKFFVSRHYSSPRFQFTNVYCRRNHYAS